MAAKTWKLIDAQQNFHAGAVEIGKSDAPGAPDGFSIELRTLRGGLREGVDVIEINNGKCRLIVVPTRGMSVWKGWCGDVELGWKSPVRGPVHPAFVALNEPSGLGWLDGFDELLVRCGLESNGAPDFDENGRLSKPLHGRIGNKPAEHVEVEIDGDEISIKGVVVESRFHFTKLRLLTTLRTKFNEPGFRIHDEVENFSASDAEMQMLYHVNFGSPFVGAGSEVSLPIDELVPRNDWAAEGIGHWSTYTEPTAGMEERVYFFKPLGDKNDNSIALLKNGASSQGVSLHYNTKQLPCFSLWKNETSLDDGYVTGLEPGTNFPNPRSFEGEKGRVAGIKPGAMYAMDLEMRVHESADTVKAIESEIGQIQSNKAPQVYDKPQSEWCA